MGEYIITSNCNCWGEVSDLIRKSIPNAVVSSLGRKFGAFYYSKLAGAEHSCVFICKSAEGEPLGVIVGSANLKAEGAFSFIDKIRLLLLANIRLFSFTFIKWLAQGVLAKIKKVQVPSCVLNAELLDIAVKEGYRGRGIAWKLVIEIESYFADRNIDEYLVKTEAANLASNRFYEKKGYELVTTYMFHGRAINRYHKGVDR